MIGKQTMYIKVASKLNEVTTQTCNLLFDAPKRVCLFQVVTFNLFIKCSGDIR